VDNPEVLPSLPDLLDSLDGDVCLSHLDELAQSLLREAAEEMDTEHRQASAEVSSISLQSTVSPPVSSACLMCIFLKTHRLLTCHIIFNAPVLPKCKIPAFT